MIDLLFALQADDTTPTAEELSPPAIVMTAQNYGGQYAPAPQQPAYPQYYRHNAPQQPLRHTWSYQPPIPTEGGRKLSPCEREHLRDNVPAIKLRNRYGSMGTPHASKPMPVYGYMPPEVRAYYNQQSVIEVPEPTADRPIMGNNGQQSGRACGLEHNV